MERLTSLTWWRQLQLSGLLMLTAVVLRGDSTDALDLQAVFLLRFGSFAEWPEEAMPEPGAPFVIGVLGDDPFGPMLDRILWGETVRGRRVRVERYRHVADIGRFGACPILFISASEAARLPAIMPALHGRPILTVSTLPQFADHGGMVTFIRQGGRVQLRINLPAVRAGGLTISSKLLRAVELVGEEAPLQ